MRLNKNRRKGFYFSMDALMSVALILASFTLIAGVELNKPVQTTSRDFQQSDIASEDGAQVLMQTKLDNAFSGEKTRELLNNTVLEKEDLNKSVMDAVATLWASKDNSNAEDAVKRFLNNTFPEEFGYRLRIENQNSTIIYSSGDFNSSSLVSRSTRMVSGAAKNKPTEGFTAKASLSNLNAVKKRYFSFGGYVGDGNITANVTLPEYGSLIGAKLEADIDDKFTVLVNGASAGGFNGTKGNLTAGAWTVCNKTVSPSACDAFSPGSNIVKLRFNGNTTSIGGGLLKVSYNESQSLNVKSGTYQTKKKKIPGVRGVINIFSSFYIPGTVENLSVNLHYRTNNTVFMTIANRTIYEDNATGEIETVLNDSRLRSTLEKGNITKKSLSNRTVPFRIGERGLSQTSSTKVDVVSVIDVSGSMTGDPLEEAKNASKTFVDVILNVSGNRAGLAAYESIIRSVHKLSQDKSSLKNMVDSLTADGNTCTGCGILEGTEEVIEPKYRKLIPPGDTWRYNISYPESEPPEIDGKSWKERGYEDANWSTGQAILGLGGSSDTQLTDNGGDYFFRNSFEYRPEIENEVKIFVRSDDAASIFVNGNLVDNDTGRHPGENWNRIIGGVTSFFSDTFERVNIGSDWTVTEGNAGDEAVISDKCSSTDGTKSLIVRWGGATIESRSFNLSNRENSTLEYSAKQGGEGSCEPPEEGENIEVQYLDDGGSWSTLKTHEATGSDPNGGAWSDYSFEIPSDGVHDSFQLRINYPTASGDDYDYWAFDQISLGEKRSFDESLLRSAENTIAARLKDRNTTTKDSIVVDTNQEWKSGNLTNTTVKDGNLRLEGAETAFADDFESGNLGSDWSCSGSCGVSTSCAVKGTYAAFHKADSGSVTSKTLNISDLDSANVSFWARKGSDSCSEDPDGSEDLVVEYRDNKSNWQELDTLTVSGLSDGEEVEKNLDLDPDALHGSFKVRFRQESGSGNDFDYWHFDDVEVFSTSLDSTEGSYTSKLFDVGSLTKWNQSNITADVPSGTNYTISYSNTSQWFDNISSVPKSRFLKFNISMNTSNQNTPKVDKVNLTYRSRITEFDLAVNTSLERNKSLIVMSDGEANQNTSMENVPNHDNDSDIDPKDHTIEAACRAQENHSIRVYAVGFGSGADESTLNQTAQCGGGEYYFASTGELEEVFKNISSTILQTSVVGQTIEIKEGDLNDTLFSDSFIEINYTSPNSLELGRFRISQESDRFGGNISSPKNGSFKVPDNTELLDASLLSYSGNRWTDRVLLQGSGGSYKHVFRLWDYDTDYSEIGDPFQVHIPPEKAKVGAWNNVSVDTAINHSDPQGGSPYSKVVFDLMVDGFVNYDQVHSKAVGGEKEVQTPDGNFTLTVGNSSDSWDPREDALDNATMRLLNKLDVDNDGVVDFKINQENLKIDKNQLSGLQWLWGPALVSLEVWQ